MRVVKVKITPPAGQGEPGYCSMNRTVPAPPAMDAYTACSIAEGFIECDSHEQYIEAWQHLIDSGLCWKLQGWIGRQAQAMIDSGDCWAA